MERILSHGNLLSVGVLRGNAAPGGVCRLPGVVARGVRFHHEFAPLGPPEPGVRTGSSTAQVCAATYGTVFLFLYGTGMANVPRHAKQRGYVHAPLFAGTRDYSSELACPSPLHDARVRQ